jgi:two-component system response regulator ResD
MWRKRRLANAPPTNAPDAARRYVAGDLMLLLDELRFKVGHADIDLTPKQASLLELLMEQPGRAFSDADILEHVWTMSSYANSSDVKQQIYLIRKRLRCAGLDASTILATVPGVGYKLVITIDDGSADARSTDIPQS